MLFLTQHCDFDRDFRISRTKNQTQNNDAYIYAREWDRDKIREWHSLVWLHISGSIGASHARKKQKKKKREREFLCSHWCFIVHKFTDKTLSWKLKWRRTEGGETEVQNREFKVKGPFGWEDEKMGR